MFAYKNWHPFSSPTWKSEAACRLCQRPRNFRAVPAPPKLDKKTTRTTATSNNHDHNHNHNHRHQQQQRQRRLMHELQNVFVVSQVPAERAQILAEVATKMQKHSQASKKCPMTHCHSGQMLFVCLTLSFLSTIKLVVSFHGPRFVSFPRFPTSTQARITIHHIEIKERLSHCSPIIQLVT